jgi:preprotein translocase subunit SecG
MFYFVLSVHVVLCFSLILLVLLQQGKGADMGPALGGASSSVFGAAGAKTVLTKVTTGVAIAFMVTSGIMVATYSEYADSINSVDEALPLTVPAASETVSPGTVSPGTVSPGTVSPGTVSPGAAAPAAAAAATESAVAPAVVAPETAVNADAVKQEPVAATQAAEATKP